MELFDRYISAIWERTKTPMGLVTVVVLVALIVGVLWFFRVDVAAIVGGWFN